MFCWRITKYNPKNRDRNGAYIKNEWTAYSDIGRSFDGQVLTTNEYLIIENAYISAIKLLMQLSGTEAMQIISLQKNTPPIEDGMYSSAMIVTYNTIKENDVIAPEKTQDVARLALRENLWCKIESAKMYIHFGYDYYMYIGIIAPPNNNVISILEKDGLFIEDFQSPY
jgi:hypothetical protein